MAEGGDICEVWKLARAAAREMPDGTERDDLLRRLDDIRDEFIMQKLAEIGRTVEDGPCGTPAGCDGNYRQSVTGTES